MFKAFTLFISFFFLNLISSAQYVTFSGVANNSTDNTAALNSAFQQGSTVFIPAGSNYYKIAGTVNIPAGKTIIFASGAKFNVTGNLKGSNTIIEAGEAEIFKNTSNINGTWETDYIYAKWTGAVGNGTTDDFAALSLFFKLLGITDNTEARLEVNKNYYIKNQIIQNVTKEINLDGRGSRIFRKYADVSTHEYIVRLDGVIATEKTLTASLVKGQFTVNVNNTSGLSNNMGIEVLSNEIYGKEDMGGGNWHYHYKGLMSTIKSINGNKLTINDTIPFDFNLNDVWAVRFFEVIPVSVRNLTFSAENITGTQHINNFAISQLFDVELDNITCDPIGYLGLSTNSIYNGLFKNITCIEPASGGDNYHFGVYGIVPQLNVNCVYENVHVQSVTHGIAFTNEPSYNVLVKDSYFRSSWYLSNAVDSHASHWVKFENDTIYGAQGNWGTFIFENCEMHEIYNGNHDIWNEREGASRGNLEVFFNNCNFYTEDNGNSATQIIYRMHSVGTTTTKYSILNSNFYLENDATYLSNAVSPGSATNIKPFWVEGNSFYGNGTLYLPKEYNSTPSTQGGVFTFKNNNYSLVYWSNPPFDQFQTINILNNTPVNANSSDFWINWDGPAGNVNFKYNHFVGACFWIKDCTGNIVFDDNDIYNDQHKSSSSYKNRNYITGNSNLIFTNNNLYNTYWTLTGNKTVTGNVYNGITQPNEPSGSWANINTPGSSVETGSTMEGVTNYTIISRAKMDDLSTNAVQNLVGSSTVKLNFGFNPIISNPLFKATIRNVDGTIVKPTLSRFYMDNQWHTYVFIMQNGVLKAYMDGIAMLSYDATAVYNKMYATGTIQIGGVNSTELWNGPIQTFAIYNRALTLAEANSFATNPNTTISGEIYKMAISNDTPVGHWKFDETSGNTAYDNSGNNFNGTLVNNPSWSNGKIENALQFNGVNQSVECGTHSKLDMGIQDFTISTWVKMNSNQVSYPTFISKGGSSTSTSGYWFYLSGTSLKLAMGDGTSRIVASSGTINIKDNLWHHISVSVNRYGKATFFVDGENKGDYDVSPLAGKLISNSTKTLNIASLGTSSTTFLNGLLDDTRIYTRALSAEEIADLADLSQNNSLIAHWAFDENSGTIAVDSSENQNNGSLVNGPTWKPGIKGSSLQFDGVNDRIDCGTDAIMDIGTG
ncbi:MAG TPA: LamG-like jellyroll fold domain-containing protein, partial [Bacteroidales bacterium]